MTGKYILDTNFLVYCYSEDEPEKRQRCLQVLQNIDKAEETVAISTQVMQEFAYVLVKKFSIDPLMVKERLKTIEESFEVVPVTAAQIHTAFDMTVLYKYSSWDSLVISRALAANCSVLLTEDLQHEQEIRGMTISDPFKDL